MRHRRWRPDGPAPIRSWGCRPSKLHVDALAATHPTPWSTSSPTTPASRSRSSSTGPTTHTFAASVEARAGGDNEFVFYDGPPFANGLPHYGHLLTGFVKDAVPRYQTMRGRRVERRFGWDCHGLPAEMEAEKELERLRAGPPSSTTASTASTTTAGPSSSAPPTPGSTTSPARPAGSTSTDDYKTMDLSYMESVMWAFKAAVGQGPRSTRASGSSPTAGSARPRCRTSRPARRRLPAPRRTRPSRCAFDARRRRRRGRSPRGRGRCGVLGWTTTPWTLPSNLALAVGPDVDLRRVRAPGRAARLIAAERAPAPTPNCSATPSRWHRCRGRSSVGRTYRPLFAFFADQAGRLPGSRRATSSPPTRAPASCTWRRDSARRTSTSARRPGSPWCARSTTGPGSPPRSRLRRPAGFRGQRAITADLKAARRPRRGRSPTPTATRTAGAPTRRSSTRP